MKLASLRQWLRRAAGSVRVRVTLLAAGAFAVVLVIAAIVLLRALESGLVADVEAAAEQRLRQQEALLAAGDLPDDVAFVEADDATVATWAWDDDGSTIMMLIPGGVEPADFLDGFAHGVDAPLDGAVDEYTAVELDLTVVHEDLADGAVEGILEFGDVPSEGEDAITTIHYFDEAVLATSSPLDDVRAAIARTTTALRMIGPALVVLVAALAWLLAGRALRPVRTMTARVAAIERGSLHARVPEPPTDDEIAALARTMNEMLGRLDAANEASKRLVADASHELRTPIAVMRTELEVARRDPTNDWDDTAVAALDELDRLARLVDDLLLLARGDERRSIVADRAEPVDLAAVAVEVVGRRRRAGIEVEAEVAAGTEAATGGDGAAVRADRAALERALDHLVANALRSATSHVVVTVVAGAGTIHVDDDGAGIPADQRAEVVKRFVRLDEARSRDSGGAGLGLAVAADVARGHGGELVIGESPLGGARVSIHLPGATG